MQSGCFVLFCLFGLGFFNTKQNIVYRCLIKMQQLFMAAHFPLIYYGRFFKEPCFSCIFICIKHSHNRAAVPVVPVCLVNI